MNWARRARGRLKPAPNEAVQNLGGRYRGTMLPPSDGPAARSEQQHEAPGFWTVSSADMGAR